MTTETPTNDVSKQEEAPDLKSQPVDEVIKVGNVAPEDGTKIGTEDFIKKLNELLSDKKVIWRSAKTLADKVGVDAIALDTWLRKRSEIASKAGKEEEGTVFYALAGRLEKKDTKVADKVKSSLSRPITTEEDRYATALLHQIYVNLHEVLDKYAMRVAERHMEAFNNLVQAKDRLEAGITLFTGAIRANIKKLPRL